MGKIWFITGSSRGLGLALVKAVLASGDSVAATARNGEHLKHVVQEYGPERMLALSLDVTNNDQIEKAIEAARAKFGRIDVVVNNAGYAKTSSIEDMSRDSFTAQMDTNFFGVVNVTKAALPVLRQQGSGHILQVSSVGGRVGSPGLGAYQSAKWAVGGFSTVLAHEVAPLGIKVTVLEPGGIKTDWAGSSMGHGPVSEPYEQTVGATSRMREQVSANWSSPDDIARAIVHVANVDDPPLRLLLGPDTIQHARMAADQLAASDLKWEEVTKLSFR
ncbi:hypothetical protein HIM_06650 [Hirsutella minnesotensis 3608]|uniref:Ketoreductase domain-containing protein n=1 Tax=Hirsutella minnesotensis 3608 TaxID=1043627 RepID=A0A0F7ZZC5_9HYPO|nr:hypothetical protein HIM_06650 [Hirsutella minnesotensis 3608]